jgi:5-enolpyruvylshikimate-3-phosphate synthase
MALAIAASLADGPSVLAGAEWVDVSYPGFFPALAGCADTRVTA